MTNQQQQTETRKHNDPHWWEDEDLDWWMTGGKEQPEPSKGSGMPLTPGLPRVKYIPPSYQILTSAILESGKVELEMPPELFAQMIAWAAQSNPKETSGFGWVTEEGRINRVFLNQRGTRNAGGVTYDSAEMLIYAMNNNLPDANLQWHTHPGFDPYWSGTDLADQDKLLVQLVSHKEGTFYVLVFDGGMEWNIRRFRWLDYGKTLWKMEGTITCCKTSFTPVPRPVYKLAKYGKTDKNKAKKKKGKWNLLEPRDKKETQPLLLPSRTPGQPKERYNKMKAGGRDYYICASRLEELTLMGKWSETRQDYRDLFDMFGVDYYRWDLLMVKINDEFPKSYFDIVDDPLHWPKLKEYFEYEKERQAKELKENEQWMLGL